MDTLVLDVTLLSSNKVCKIDAEEMAVAGGSTTRAAVMIPVHFCTHL